MTDLTAIYRDKSPSFGTKSTPACTHLLIVAVVVWLLLGNGISILEGLFGASQGLAPELRRGALVIGYLHFMADQCDAALQSFGYAVSADPVDSAAHAAIGRVYHKMRLIDKAIAELEISIELSPNEIMSYWVLGEICEEKGMSKEAQNYKDKALAVADALRKKRKAENPRP